MTDRELIDALKEALRWALNYVPTECSFDADRIRAYRELAR